MRNTAICLAACMLFLMNGLIVHSADIVLGLSVSPAQRVSLANIDHSPWTKLLRTYVDEQGLVNYTAWNSSTGGMQALEAYLAQLSHASGEGSRQEKIAFWINAYNAVTIKGILREYPTSSIRNHTARFLGYNIWKNLKLQVGGELYSLDQMEHDILRKLNEPRIHFAIVCASIGCPRLLNEAYTADRLEHQLSSNTRSFFNDPTKFRYDSTQDKFYLSPILKWFGDDFGDTRTARLNRIAPWIPDRVAARAAAIGRGSISYLDYDWGLNDRQ